MEFFPITSWGKPYREFYHLSYSDDEFKLCLYGEIWKAIVSLTKEGTHFASRHGSSFMPPAEKGGLWGFGGTSNADILSDEWVMVSVMSVPKLRGNHQVEITNSAKTLSLMLDLIMFYAHDNAGQLILENDQNPQLFHMETIVAEKLHGGSFDLSVSLQARKYLCRLGKSYIDGARCSMFDHWKKFHLGKSNIKVSPSWFDVHTRGRGLLHISTLGNCACLGTAPDSFSDEEGCYLTSHNVDTSYQQFNMIVAIAYIWQMVRSGLEREKVEPK